MDKRASQPKSIMIKAGTVVFGLLTLGMMVLTFVSDRGLIEVRRKAARLAELDRRILEIETENSVLIEEIHTLRTDPAEIERRAREEHKMVFPGEVILVIPSMPE